MTKRLRVAVVSGWYPLPTHPYQGVFVRDQLEALSPSCDVSVLVPQEASVAEVMAGRSAELDGAVRVVPMPRWPLALPARALVLWRALAAAEPDVVHVHLLVPDALPGLFAARRLGVPVVVTEHAGFLTDLARSRRARFQIVQALRRADAIVVPSTHLARILQRYEPRVRPAVIGNPIDMRLFRPDPESPRDVALSACLNLGEAKGTDVLLRAWAKARSEADLPRLVLVGDGPERGRFESLTRTLGFADDCEFAGRKSRPELAALMQRASFFVSPSRSENFAGVVAEALACGTPVVSSRVGGPDEYVTDGVGLLVEPGDEAELTAALVRMATEARRYDPERLHRHVEGQFGYEQLRVRLLDLYRSVGAG